MQRPDPPRYSYPKGRYHGNPHQAVRRKIQVSENEWFDYPFPTVWYNRMCTPGWDAAYRDTVPLSQVFESDELQSKWRWPWSPIDPISYTNVRIFRDVIPMLSVEWMSTHRTTEPHTIGDYRVVT